MRNQILDKTLPIRLDEKGEVFLGLPTGITGRSFSITKLVSSNKLSGWIVKDGNLAEWKPAGMIQKDSDTFVYGKYTDGKVLETVFDETIPEQLSALNRLARAFKTLMDNKIEVSFLATNSILFTEDGGVFILPPDLMHELLNFYGQEEKCLAAVACNHPDTGGEKKLSYFLGCLAYRIVTGAFPFSGNVEENVRYEIRNRNPVAPDYKRPALKPEAASVIMKALGTTAPGAVRMEDWVSASDAWVRDGIDTAVSDAIAQKKIREGESIEKRRMRSVRRKHFWQRNRGRFLAITLPVLAVSLIVGVSLANTVFRERVTKGFSPLKVVRTYYECINTLNVTTLGDCVTGDAGSNDLNWVTNLYVITKQASAYDLSSHYVTAEEWDRKGRPKLEETANMYGITRLDIKTESEDPEPVFLVTYERWYTDKDPNAEQWELANIVTGVKVEDRLYLKRIKGDWVIYRINRVKEEPIKTN